MVKQANISSTLRSAGLYLWLEKTTAAGLALALVVHLMLSNYDESKRAFSILIQQENIDVIKKIENRLTPADKERANAEAEKLSNRKLTNLANLFKQDL